MIESDDNAKYDIFYSQSKAETIVNESEINDVFESIYTPIISGIKTFLEKVQAGLLTQSKIINIDFNISKYIALVGSSYIKLSEDSDYPRKGLINIQNIDDNQCSK